MTSVRHGPLALMFITAMLTSAELLAAPATAAPEQATRAVNELKVTLKKELEQAMAAGGPENAIAVCQQRAPALAQEIGHKHDVLVGRTSHKVRNPDNAPRPWVKAVLDEWLEAPAGSWTPRVVSLDKGIVGYVEPIPMQGACVACHGEQTPEPLRTKIRTMYHDDRATGFKVGELRGVFWTEVKSKNTGKKSK
jgi:hypothetical protein